MESEEQAPSRSIRSHWGWVLVAFLIALLLVAAVVLVVETPEDDPPDAPEPTVDTSDESGQPVVVQEATELTVPDTIRMPSQSFDGKEGDTYLLEFEAAVQKPRESPGAAMYFGTSLACGSPDGGTLRSVGGTQNILTGQRVTIRNHFLLEIEETGEHSCRLSVFAPNPDVDARGTTADVDTQWSATLLEGGAFEAPVDERLPRLVGAEERAAAFRFEVDLESGSTPQIDVLGTVHVTTCTEVEGSSEDGRTWCLERDVDEEGSEATFTYRADVLNDSGEVCDSRVLGETRAHVDRRTHHRLFHFDRSVAYPPSLCGDTLRIVVAVENNGPAPLLIHRASSNLVITTGS